MHTLDSFVWLVDVGKVAGCRCSYIFIIFCCVTLILGVCVWRDYLVSCLSCNDLN